MPVDFSKPIEVQHQYDVPTEWRPARVLGAVNYSNSSFTHAVAVLGERGGECVYAANPCGYVEGGYIIRNTPPKVVKESWVNLYSNGCTGGVHATKKIADQNDCGVNRFGYYVTKTYDNGSVTNEVIKIEE